MSIVFNPLREGLRNPVGFSLGVSTLALQKYEGTRGSHRYSPEEMKALSDTTRYLRMGLEGYRMLEQGEQFTSGLDTQLDILEAYSVVSRAARQGTITQTRIGRYADILETVCQGKHPRVETISRIKSFIGISLMESLNEEEGRIRELLSRSYPPSLEFLNVA